MRTMTTRTDACPEAEWTPATRTRTTACPEAEWAGAVLVAAVLAVAAAVAAGAAGMATRRSRAVARPWRCTIGCCATRPTPAPGTKSKIRRGSSRSQRSGRASPEFRWSCTWCGTRRRKIFRTRRSPARSMCSIATSVAPIRTSALRLPCSCRWRRTRESSSFLASADPSGAPTTGITRRQTTVASFSSRRRGQVPGDRRHQRVARGPLSQHLGVSARQAGCSATRSSPAAQPRPTAWSFVIRRSARSARLLRRSISAAPRPTRSATG